MNRDLLEDLFHNTIAVGRSARGIRQRRNTNNTQDTSQREPLGEISTQSRKRAASPDDTTDPSPEVKRRVTGGHMLSTSMNGIQAQMEKNRISRERRQQLMTSTQEKSQQLLTSEAIQVLEKDYDGRWLEDNMIKAIELFTDSGKAANVFLSLKTGGRRDRWLEVSLWIWTPQPVVENVTTPIVTNETINVGENPRRMKRCYSKSMVAARANSLS